MSPSIMNRWTGDSGGAKAKNREGRSSEDRSVRPQLIAGGEKNFPGAGPVSKTTKNFRLQQGGLRLYICKFLFKFT